MVHAARALELGVMVGCMVESGLAIARPAPSPASVTTLTSTGTCSWPTTPGKAWSWSTASSCPPSAPGWAWSLALLGDGGKEASGRRGGQYK